MKKSRVFKFNNEITSKLNVLENNQGKYILGGDDCGNPCGDFGLTGSRSPSYWQGVRCKLLEILDYQIWDL